jgi:DNA-binding NarL/FixJ family response regulator
VTKLAVAAGSVPIMNAGIRVIVVEDDVLVGRSLASLIGGTDGFEVVGIASGVGSAVGLAKEPGADVVLSDLGLGDGLALSLPCELAPTGTPVLWITAHTEAGIIRDAITSGAAGLLHKSDSAEALFAAIRNVAAGRTSFGRGDLALVREAPRAPTRRERDVLDGLVRGLASKEIAADLGIDVRTVDTHVARMSDRYDTDNRVALAVLALREGWVVAGQPRHK